MNIYLNKSGEYYYSRKKINNKDRQIDSAVSIDYAFNFCNKMNYGGQTILVSSRRMVSHTIRPNEAWKKQHDLLIKCI